MALSGRGREEWLLQPVIQPLPPRSNRPPSDWASADVVEGRLRITLRGWRSLLAIRRQLTVPVELITSIRVEPLVYGQVPTSLRLKSRPRAHVYRLGVYRGIRGWSFWACGMGRNAVLIETERYRFRYIVVERSDPAALVSMIERALCSAGPGSASRRELTTMGAEVSFEEYLEAVEAGARRLADVASERPEEVPIPTCPEWSCADLLAHLGGVFEFFSARVAAADQSEPHEPERSIPASGQLVNWLERRAAALVESLRRWPLGSVLELVGTGPHDGMGSASHGARDRRALLRRRGDGRGS